MAFLRATDWLVLCVCPSCLRVSLDYTLEENRSCLFITPTMVSLVFYIQRRIINVLLRPTGKKFLTLHMKEMEKIL